VSDWSPSQLLAGLHADIQYRLEIVRKSFDRPGTKGDASEAVWLDLLQSYLPERYQAATAHLVDCEGKFRDQIDVVVFDRQYSPFIFRYEGQTIVPAESVYAAFEAKQTTIDRHSVLACGRHRQRAGSDRAELWRVPQHEFDPGYAMVNVAKRWSADDFNDFMTQVKSSAASARAALDSPDENESKKLWRRLFGSTFGQ
jgi:uncharacterized protein DUF6602